MELISSAPGPLTPHAPVGCGPPESETNTGAICSDRPRLMIYCEELYTAATCDTAATDWTFFDEKSFSKSYDVRMR